MGFYVIIRGPLGCGKSTIAEKVAKIIKAEYVPIDRVLDENKLTEQREDGYISQNSFLKANEIICQKIRPLLEKGARAVIDGNFYWKSQIDDLIKRLDFPCYVFTLKAPLKICIERDKHRVKTHGKDAAQAVYKKAVEFDYGIAIDVNRDLETCIKDILSHVPK